MNKIKKAVKQQREKRQQNEKYREDGRALSRLRTAWQAAKKSVQLDHNVPRKTGKEGEQEDVIPERDAESLAARWNSQHRMTMSIYLRPTDGLMAKIWREIQRSEHTVHTEKKIKSIFQATLPNTEESVPPSTRRHSGV